MNDLEQFNYIQYELELLPWIKVQKPELLKLRSQYFICCEIKKIEYESEPHFMIRLKI